jgi:hypothetical protein
MERAPPSVLTHNESNKNGSFQTDHCRWYADNNSFIVSSGAEMQGEIDSGSTRRAASVEPRIPRPSGLEGSIPSHLLHDLVGRIDDDRLDIVGEQDRPGVTLSNSLHESNSIWQ